MVEVVTATVAGEDDVTVEADRRGPSASAGADGVLHGSFADLFGAEEPVFACDTFFGPGHPVGGHTAGAGGRNDDRVAGLPIGRGGHPEAVGGLQCLDQAQQLIKIAAGAQRVVGPPLSTAGRETGQTAKIKGVQHFTRSPTRIRSLDSSASKVTAQSLISKRTSQP